MSYASIKQLHRDAMPVPGLPEPLPNDEQMLWQGSPDFSALARSAFHGRALTVYFVAILLVQTVSLFSAGGSLGSVAIALAWLIPLFAAAMAMVYTMAWFTARTTVYTITSKRVVMHIGVVLDLTLNLPFDSIDSVGLRLGSAGHGDLPLKLLGSDKIAYFHLWPHARPWRVAKPEPMLRSVAHATEVAKILGDALRLRLAEAQAPVASPLRLVRVEAAVESAADRDGFMSDISATPLPKVPLLGAAALVAPGAVRDRHDQNDRRWPEPDGGCRGDR